MFYEEFYRNLSTKDALNNKNAINDPISVVVFVTAKDDGSMLRNTHLNETVWIVDDLATNFHLTGKNFYEFCTDFCQLNEPIRQFKVYFFY